jgi:hypothetical protein
VGWTRAVGVGIDGDVRGEKVSLISRTTCFRPALCFPSLSFLQASENGCHANHSSPMPYARAVARLQQQGIPPPPKP